MLLFVTVSVNVLFILLSFLGLHPWLPFNSRCISLSLLVVLCMSAFLGELLKPLFDSPGIMKYYFISSLLLITLYLRKETFSLRLGDNNTYLDFQKIAIKDFKRIYVDRWEGPCVRYLFEYGSLKPEKGKSYPEKFTFAKYGRLGYYEGRKPHEEIYMSQPKMNDLLDYDLLITPELNKFGNNNRWVNMDGTINFWVKSKTLPVQSKAY